MSTLRLSALAFASVAVGLAWLFACGTFESSTVGVPWTEDGSPGPGDSSRPSTASSTDGSTFDAGPTLVSKECKPLTCADQGIECGAAGDGCGGLISDCGQCQGSLRCGGPAAPSKCVSPHVGGCFPKTCEEVGIECGPARDGCGGIITSCGTCDGGTQCGGEGAYSKCVTPTSDAGCSPRTCEDAGVSCGGPVPDGCGGLLTSCGTCTGNLVCKNGACVTGCSPRTCTEAGAECGYVADGCGGVIDCWVCPDGFTCGSGGQPYKCGRVAPQ